MTPFFSIIIPCYNRSHLIIDTLESIRNQQFDAYEVLLIDDGSTDDTSTVIREYIEKHGLEQQFRYYRKENGERGAARNWGTQLSQGSYVNWFDSDDLMQKDHLFQVFESIRILSSPAFIASSYRLATPSGHVLAKSNYPPDIRSVLYRGNFFACSPVFVRKDVAAAQPFIENRALSGSEDYELWLRIASGFQLHTLLHEGVVIVQHEERSVNSMPANQLIERFETFIRSTSTNQEIVAFLGSHLRYFLMKNYLLLAVELAFTGNKKQALKYLKISGSHSLSILGERGFYATIKHLILR